MYLSMNSALWCAQESGNWTSPPCSSRPYHSSATRTVSPPYENLNFPKYMFFMQALFFTDVAMQSQSQEIQEDWKPSFLSNEEFTHLMLEVNRQQISQGKRKLANGCFIFLYLQSSFAGTWWFHHSFLSFGQDYVRFRKHNMPLGPRSGNTTLSTKHLQVLSSIYVFFTSTEWLSWQNDLWPNLGRGTGGHQITAKLVGRQQDEHGQRQG